VDFHTHISRRRSTPILVSGQCAPITWAIHPFILPHISPTSPYEGQDGSSAARVGASSLRLVSLLATREKVVDAH